MPMSVTCELWLTFSDVSRGQRESAARPASPMNVSAADSSSRFGMPCRAVKPLSQSRQVSTDSARRLCTDASAASPLSSIEEPPQLSDSSASRDASASNPSSAIPVHQRTSSRRRRSSFDTVSFIESSLSSLHLASESCSSELTSPSPSDDTRCARPASVQSVPLSCSARSCRSWPTAHMASTPTPRHHPRFSTASCWSRARP
mmetsp:Transcript_1794/g.7183  ORF Transcript_1794/g.7183 Transcript_1794/m.7183 type:complete len:203 (+) Transcript_1794:599-1207(+)